MENEVCKNIPGIKEQTVLKYICVMYNTQALYILVECKVSLSLTKAEIYFCCVC